jgi:hypothetical protein
MIRYGILPANFDLTKHPVDVYETDRAYWRSLWYQPPERIAGDAQQTGIRGN